MLLAVMMITAAFSAPGFDWFYPLRVVATLAVLACYWPVYRARGYLTWSWSWTPLLIGVAVFIIWRALEPLAGVSASANVEQASALASLSPLAALCWLVFRSIGSIVVVPLAEELSFRGFLTRHLAGEDFERVPLGRFTWFSFIVSSVLFGALHGRWLAGTIAGMLFAAALYRRGRMMDAILAHATANALVTLYVLTTADWAAWS
jgi:CAAX prenyl protease-like protein